MPFAAATGVPVAAVLFWNRQSLENRQTATGYMRWLLHRKRESLRDFKTGFFSRRGSLDLRHDGSAHRRYSYIYEDMLE